MCCEIEIEESWFHFILFFPKQIYIALKRIAKVVTANSKRELQLFDKILYSFLGFSIFIRERNKEEKKSAKFSRKGEKIQIILGN